VDRELRLELSDASLRRDELSPLGRRDAGLEAGVNARLTAPGVDRLLAYLELGSDLGNLPTAIHQIHYASPELRRVASSCHLVLLLREWQRGLVFSLRRSRDMPEPPANPGRFTRFLTGFP